MKKLERRLSLFSVIAIGIGGMLGSGIFVLPGIAAAKTGPSVWLAYLLAALCVLPAALSKAELATSMPTSGGTYVYIERTFGPIMGTISGIGLWLSLLLKSSFALVGFGAYLLVFANIPLKMTAIFFLILILLLNLLGVKKVGNVQIGIVSFSILGLILILIFGIHQIEPEHLQPAFIKGNTGLLSATAFVFVSYAGVTKVAAIAEEIKKPGRNLPIAMLLALGTVTIIYVSVTFTLVGNIPYNQLGDDIHPIYTLTEHLGGKSIGIAGAILGVVTLISMANSGVLAASRFPFAMSRDKLLPPVLNRVHKRYLTPYVTIFLTCVLMAIVILILDVERIAKLASAFTVFMFVLVNTSVIVLRETAVQWYDPPYKSPLYPFIQIFGIISGIGLLFFLGLFPLFALVTICILGFSVYLFYGRHRSQRSGVLKQYGHLPALYLLYNRKINRERKIIGEFLPERIREFNLDGKLSSEAEVVVTFFGNERSAEIIAEIGGAISQGNKMQVIHLTEIPEQMSLNAVLEDKPIIQSLNRRIMSMAEHRNVDVDFDAAVTHELVDTVHAISDQVHCKWLVMSWNGRAQNGILINNPIGWLVSHIKCNFALYKDNGVRYINKILVCVRPGFLDPEFIETVDIICQFYNADVTLLRILNSDALDTQEKECRAQSIEVTQHCKSDFKIVLIKSDEPVRTIRDSSAYFDLMITGTPRRDNWVRVLFGTGKDKLTAASSCSVLRLTLFKSETKKVF